MVLTDATTATLVVQARTVLRSDAGDLGVGVRVSPDQVVIVRRVLVNVLCAQLIGNIVELVVLPAISGQQPGHPNGLRRGGLPDQDVARSIVAIDNVTDARVVLLLARGVDGDAKLIGQGNNGVIGALLRAVCVVGQVRVSKLEYT